VKFENDASKIDIDEADLKLVEALIVVLTARITIKATKRS
jgi:hypothetical protein